MYALVREWSGVRLLQDGKRLKFFNMRTNVSFYESSFSLGTTPNRNTPDRYEYSELVSVNGVPVSQIAPDLNNDEDLERLKGAIEEIMATISMSQAGGNAGTTPPSELVFVNTTGEAEAVGADKARLIFNRNTGDFYRYTSEKGLQKGLFFDDTQS